ncbi:MAG: acetyltransferase [Polyangiaceae bacterium]|jgi:acetyltransferase-like isoleucine patch superfamily enzyme
MVTSGLNDYPKTMSPHHNQISMSPFAKTGGLGARISAGARRAVGRIAVAYRLRNCTNVGSQSKVVGRIWVHGGGRIAIGRRVFLDASAAPIELHAFPGAEIEIGDDVVIEGGTSVEAMRSVRIGARSHIGTYCKIIDGHFHALNGERRELVAADQVIIQAGVVLEPHSIIVAGRVGEGTLVGARAVVTRQVRSNMVVRGFPAMTEARGAA